MASVTSLRAGSNFEEDGEIFEVLSYDHIKMGRGSANVKVKVKNMRSGSITDKSFISHAQVKDVALEKRILQFLYKDAENAYFMDPKTFEQFSIPVKILFGHEFLKEGGNAEVKFFGDEPLSLILPPKVTLAIADTPPGVKGNSASNVYKDAILENGIKARVPLFIEIGDKVVIDTRDYSYTKRA
jgi:elongation factor P